MAKPVTPTPTIKGRAAVKIQREIAHGTPNTPNRVMRIEMADRIFRRVNLAPAKRER